MVMWVRRVSDAAKARAVQTPIREAAQRWQESRVDVAENTRLQHRSAVRAMLPLIGDRRVDTITAADVADLIASLSANRKRETVLKTLMALAMVLDHAGVKPNPARDKLAVKLPREERQEIAPPLAEHVEAVHRLLPARYRLPLLVLDGTGMRLGELEGLRWGDVASHADAGASRRPSPRRGGRGGFRSLPRCSRRCSSSFRATIGHLSAVCSRASVATDSAPR